MATRRQREATDLCAGSVSGDAFLTPGGDETNEPGKTNGYSRGPVPRKVQYIRVNGGPSATL